MRLCRINLVQSMTEGKRVHRYSRSNAIEAGAKAPPDNHIKQLACGELSILPRQLLKMSDTNKSSWFKS